MKSKSPLTFYIYRLTLYSFKSYLGIKKAPQGAFKYEL